MRWEITSYLDQDQPERNGIAHFALFLLSMKKVIQPNDIMIFANKIAFYSHINVSFG